MAIFRFYKKVAVRHIGLIKFQNFNCQYGLKGQYASLCQNVCRSVKPLLSYDVFAAVTFCDLVTLTFHLLTLDSGHIHVRSHDQSIHKV